MYLWARHCHTTLNPKNMQETPPDDDQTCLAACWINTLTDWHYVIGLSTTGANKLFRIGSNGKISGFAHKGHNQSTPAV